MGIKPWVSRALARNGRSLTAMRGPQGQTQIHQLPVKKRIIPDVVMIVDSNPVRLGDLSELAQSEGMRVLAFSDAHAALAWLSEKPMPAKVMMAWSNGSWASEKLSSLLSICRADFLIFARDVEGIPTKFKRYASAVVPLGADLGLLIDHVTSGPAGPAEFGSRHLAVC